MDGGKGGREGGNLFAEAEVVRAVLKWLKTSHYRYSAEERAQLGKHATEHQ